MDIREAAFLVIENFLFEKEKEDKDNKKKSPKKTEDPEHSAVSIHQAAVALGRRGGKEGGPARQAQLTDDGRENLARKAANARWGKKIGKPYSKERWKKKSEHRKEIERRYRKKHKRHKKHHTEKKD